MNKQEFLKAEKFAKQPIEKLALATAQNMNFHMPFNACLNANVIDASRHIVDLKKVLDKINNPLDQAGEKVEIHTEEKSKIYNCLKTMPHCIKSMEITRGDKDGVIGKNKPLKNTICVAIHHLDDKSYGGLCVLREWGAKDMVTIFVGYNPLQTKVWRDMLNDIEDEKFTTCILESTPPVEGAPVWAEGIYRVVKDFNKFPKSIKFPSDEFDSIFEGNNKTRKPLSFLNAQRSLSAYNFLMALAKGIKESKSVFVWEDGGYLNPIIDEAIENDISLADFRKEYMLPDDIETDKIINNEFSSFKECLQKIFIGSVELTRNGYDMTAEIAERRPLNTNFFSIAASYEKIMLEGDSIVLACLDALSQVLYSTGVSLRNRNVLVLGARGNLGRLSAKHLTDLLEDSKKQLWCCDIKLDWPRPKPNSIPKWAEWSAPNKSIDNVVSEVSAYDELPDEDKYKLEVILGWTGGPKTVIQDGKIISYKTITGQNIEDWLTNGREKADLYLVSGSTKTVEFSDVLIWLEQLINTPKKERKINGIKLDKFIVDVIPDELSIAAIAQMWPDDDPPKKISRNFGTMFTFFFKQDGVKVKKTLYLVNNTMPVNFMFYGTPTEIMDMTYSQVCSCAVAMVKNRYNTGIYPTDYNKLASDNVYLAQKLDRDYEIPKPFVIDKNYDDVLDGAKVAYMAYFSYVKTVIDKLGEEEALKLMTISDTARGTKAGEEIRGDKPPFDLEKTRDTIIEMAKGIGGIDTIIEQDNKHVCTLTALGKCPVYEAGHEIGMSDKMIEKICRASSLAFLDNVVQTFNPELCYKVRDFRNMQKGGCIEEITYKE